MGANNTKQQSKFSTMIENRFYQTNEQKSHKIEKPPLKRLKFWVNPAAISLWVESVLIGITILIECIYFGEAWVGGVEIAVVIICAFLITMIIGFFWINELYFSAWTIAYFPLIAILPVIFGLAYRKIILDGTTGVSFDLKL